MNRNQPGRRLRHLAESKQGWGCLWALGSELETGAYGEPGSALSMLLMGLSVSASFFSLAHTGFSVSYLVHMAEHGCQLLLNFTCSSLDRQGEIDVRHPVPVPEFLGKGLIGPARSAVHSRIVARSGVMLQQYDNHCCSLWVRSGGQVSEKRYKVNNPACAHRWDGVGMR